MSEYLKTTPLFFKVCSAVRAHTHGCGQILAVKVTINRSANKPRFDRESCSQQHNEKVQLLAG
jgi:hypothetical protein